MASLRNIYTQANRDGPQINVVLKNFVGNSNSGNGQMVSVVASRPEDGRFESSNRSWTSPFGHPLLAATCFRKMLFIVISLNKGSKRQRQTRLNSKCYWHRLTLAEGGHFENLKNCFSSSTQSTANGDQATYSSFFGLRGHLISDTFL